MSEGGNITLKDVNRKSRNDGATQIHLTDQSEMPVIQAKSITPLSAQRPMVTDEQVRAAQPQSSVQMGDWNSGTPHRDVPQPFPLARLALEKLFNNPMTSF